MPELIRPLLVLSALALAGCGGGDAETVTATVTVSETLTRTKTRAVTTTVAATAPLEPAVYIPESGGRLLYKPDVIVTGASGGAIYFDRWLSYGGPTAQAEARFEYKDCTPNCAAGTFSYVNATVELGPIVSCHSTPIYEGLLVIESEDAELEHTRVPLEPLCREGDPP